MAERARLEVRSQCLKLGSPARGILTDHAAALVALTDAGELPEVDLPLETCACKAARVPGQGPAHRLAACTVVMHVLLGFIGVVPLYLRLEAAGLLVEFDRRHGDVHDAFER